MVKQQKFKMLKSIAFGIPNSNSNLSIFELHNFLGGTKKW